MCAVYVVMYVNEVKFKSLQSGSSESVMRDRRLQEVDSDHQPRQNNFTRDWSYPRCEAVIEGSEFDRPIKDRPMIIRFICRSSI